MILPGYYLRFSRPVQYLKFGDLLEQDEFNAVSFFSEFGVEYTKLCINSRDVVNIMHNLNCVYFYSLCRFLMTNLSEMYEIGFYAELSIEKFNIVMRGASYGKEIISRLLKDIKDECNQFDIKVHDAVELFHSLLNPPRYSYELKKDTVYEKFCHTLFPNRFYVSDDCSDIELRFYYEEARSIMDTSMGQVFDDYYQSDHEEGLSIVDTSMNRVFDGHYQGDDEEIKILTRDPNTFQESLEIVFNEHKSLQNDYETLQKDYETLQKEIAPFRDQLHIFQCENEQLKETIVHLKEEKLNRDVREQRLKDFMANTF